MRLLKLGICVLVLALCAARLNAQTEDELKALNNSMAAEIKACEQIQPSQKRTYDLRTSPLEQPTLNGAYGPRKWYQKLFPFLFKQNPSAEVLQIQTLLTQPIPFGETERSQQIRSGAETKLIEIQKSAEQNWQNWLKENPKATPDEIEQMELRIRFQGLAAERLERFDWRRNGLDVGEVGFQGSNCNTCWAFATLDAMQISRRLVALRAGKTGINETMRPSVQQLVSCMSPEKTKYCLPGWHGKAFTYMVDEGLPLGGPTLYHADESLLWSCDSDFYYKALTWDFVSKDPRGISTKEEIKRALILYGSVVAEMRFDACWWVYGKGTFNGENKAEVNHFVVIIGWDDKKDGGAWLVKNSYGKNWGEGGFGWVKYGSNSIGVSSAWVLADPQEEERLANELTRKEEK